MKNPSTENVRRGWCRVVGVVKVSLLAVCGAVATNMRMLRSWAENIGGYDDPLCAPWPPDHGFEELTEERVIVVKRSSQPPRAGPTLDPA